MLSARFLTLSFLTTFANATPCNDGWESPSSGSGTCSHHGGASSSYYRPEYNSAYTPHDIPQRTLRWRGRYTGEKFVTDNECYLDKIIYNEGQQQTYRCYYKFGSAGENGRFTEAYLVRNGAIDSILVAAADIDCNKLRAALVFGFGSPNLTGPGDNPGELDDFWRSSNSILLFTRINADNSVCELYLTNIRI